MTSPAYDQDAYRGRNDDDTESAATWKTASNNQNWTQDVDANFRLRFVVQEYNNKAANNIQFAAQYNLNSGGWNDITTTSSVVKSVGSSYFTDEDAAYQRIGSGTFVAGVMDDDGNAGENGPFDFSGNDEVEIEFCFQIVGADVNNNDTVQIQVVLSGGTVLDNYTNTPSITVSKAGLLKIIDESEGVSETSQRRLSLLRAIAETVGLSEGEQYLLTIIRLIAETVGLSETLVRPRVMARILGETLSITDSVVRSRVMLRILAESLTISEGAARLVSMVRLLAETVSLSETSGKVVGFVRAVSDTVGLSETTQKVAGFIRSVSETVSISEATQRTLALVRLIAETVGLSETLVRPRVMARVLGETLSITDSVVRPRVMLRILAETVGLPETITRARSLLRLISETVGITENGLYNLVVTAVLDVARTTVAILSVSKAISIPNTIKQVALLTTGKDVAIDPD